MFIEIFPHQLLGLFKVLMQLYLHMAQLEGTLVRRHCSLHPRSLLYSLNVFFERIMLLGCILCTGEDINIKPMIPYITQSVT